MTPDFHLGSVSGMYTDGRNIYLITADSERTMGEYANRLFRAELLDKESFLAPFSEDDKAIYRAVLENPAYNYEYVYQLIPMGEDGAE